MAIGNWYIKRAIYVIITLIGVSIIVFSLVRIMPGDPIIIMLGEQLTKEEYEYYRGQLGLDQPIHIQYFIYFQRLLVGDWGQSIMTKTPVLPLVLRRFKATLELTIAGMILASLLGIGLGILGALKKDTKIDFLSRVVSLSGISIPIFWFGLMLILVFSVYFKVLPSMGRGGIENLILPSITLAFFACGIIGRITRAAMLEVMNEDFVLVARAKGLSRNRILYYYIIRNALVPIVTVVGLQFGALLAGAIITETVFTYPGLGLLIVENIYKRDYPVVQGALLFAAISVALTNMGVDLLYPLIDPRMRRR